MFWKRKTTKQEGSVLGQETSLEREPPSESLFPRYIVNSLLNNDEVYISDTPLEEPVDEAVGYEAWRRDTPRYGNKSVVGNRQLHGRLYSLLNGPTLRVCTPKDEHSLPRKPVKPLEAYDPSPEQGEIDLFGDLSPHLKELLEYGQRNADLIVMIQYPDGTVQTEGRRITRDILPPKGELNDGFTNKLVRERREYYGVPIFVDTARGYTMPLIADRHYASVVDPLPSKN